MNRENEKRLFVGVMVLVALNGVAWYQVLAGKPASREVLYFLNVGQGDAQLLTLPGNVKILTDAGPDRSVIPELQKILPSFDRFIDVVVITHPQADHFNGLNFILDRYWVGAVVMNGRQDDPPVAEWTGLLEKLARTKTPVFIAGAGDGISYGTSRISFLSPSKDALQSAELNDTGLVELVKTPSFSEFAGADIDSATEEELAARYDISADILKVAHHGSRFSSSVRFLRAVSPAIAVIEVGRGNSYGHPSPQTLSAIENATQAEVFRTDRDGTVKITRRGQNLAATRLR